MKQSGNTGLTLETETDTLSLRARVVYTIGSRSDLNPILPSFSWYNLYLMPSNRAIQLVTDDVLL